MNDSCQELSAELAGEGGAAMCSLPDQGDLNWNESCGPGVVGGKFSLLWNGFKWNGPRGNGSTRGRGGRRRSSPRSEPLIEVVDLRELISQLE